MSDAAPDPQERGECPGLSCELPWDEPSLLRSELYASEQLVQHAQDLARAHGAPVSRRTAGPLRKRFGRARAQLNDAYEVLARNAKLRQDPTPAEEWLLENSHIVEDQLREIREDLPRGYLVELPRLGRGTMRDYPRVYGLCLDYLRHTDARVDLKSLSDYVVSYQSVAELTIGELWAVPIMLRLGLTLLVSALAVTEANARGRDLADEWATRFISDADDTARLERALHELQASGVELSAAFLVRLLKRVREHDAPLAPVVAWIATRCETMGLTPEELTRRQHLRQAADQVSVGNAISSMRAIAALDWTEFFEATSRVEEVLRRDPARAYAGMDQPSRDRCRHAVEKLARRSRRDEYTVALRALSLATAADEVAAGSAAAHVGYYLLDDGRPELESALGYRPRVSERLARAAGRHPALCYLGSAGLLFLAAAAVAAWVVFHQLSGWFVPLLLLGLLALPLSEAAIAVVNAVALAVVPPRLLQKLDFELGIPDEHRTLVVVPCLLDSPAGVAELLQDLEIRALGNPDKNLFFALLTDFPDSDRLERESDGALLNIALEGIRKLNMGAVGERYFLLHRRRVSCPAEGRYMGYERKRGKLHELNRLLRGATNTTFERVTAPAELLESIRYVITLDSDTELPREVARRLVGAMAHPLNRPVVDLERRRVTRGHALLQPRVGVSPFSARRSRFARIFAGAPGIDPYTTAVSDLYQDAFGEGSFLGKGIYDVDAFSMVMRGRVPDNAMLSHDLFEGIFARCALVSDIEVLDEQPASYEVVASRDHRWLRGDWQLVPWLMPRVPAEVGSRPNDLRVLDAWKLLDNLRRSLVPPALLLVLVAASFGPVALLPWAALLAALVFLLPVAVRLVLTLTRAALAPQVTSAPLGGELWSNLQQVAMSFALLLERALLSVDAIARTAYRLLVSRKHLLEWTTMRQATRSQNGAASPTARRLAVGMWFALVPAAAVLLGGAGRSVYALVLAVPWLTAPALLAWLGRIEHEPAPDAELADEGRRRLRLLARKTWRFFDQFVTAKDNWLPPDNYQEEPRGVVAHRTSPTNIGLYLLSVVSAHDLGFIQPSEVLERITRTLDTIGRLERRSGHVLNWYDTVTLRPLEPQYVSTVDSGNLAGYLWTLREACVELASTPLIEARVLEAARDALSLAAAELGKPTPPQLQAVLVRLEQSASELAGGSIQAFAVLCGARDAVSELAEGDLARAASAESRYWLSQAVQALVRACDQVVELAPCLELLGRASCPAGLDQARYAELVAKVASASTPLELAAAAAGFQDALPSLTHIAEAEALAFARSLSRCLLSTVQACNELSARASEQAERALALADGMDFRFLYDDQRSLFTIGYNVSGARLDGSHYDLLASEARLASLVAISKGDAPLEHWWKLGRPRTSTTSGKVLLSWSGSMFEYLMPLLVTGVSRDTLLWETCNSVVARQRQYGEERDIPWGISESAYNVMDLGMCYQYRAFGVPGLGFKTGLAEDLVVAPYASVLSALVRPDLALENFDALDRLGLSGKYGYYEAVDFTDGRVPPGRRAVVVKAFMAHHQGMSLVALCNLLCNWPMKRRFFADARVKASALLLEERLPLSAPVTAVQAVDMVVISPAEPELRLADHVGLSAPGVERLHLLGHGELSSIVTAAGTGVLSWRGMDVTRFREDAALDSHGILIYVRNISTRELWSVGQRPVQAVPDYYDASFSIDRVELKRRDRAIETVTELAVSPEHPLEVRRITLTNHGADAAQLDVTSYTEPVLATRGADVAHRAFSSMFLNVELLPERSAILVRRRPRSASESEVWLVQAFTAEEGDVSLPELEGSRAEFIGRGGSLAKPRAMSFDQQLSGTAGDVLDPGLALRLRFRIGAGGRARAVLTTALATSREAALELLDLITTPHAAARVFELAWADARVELRHLGVTAARSHRFQRLLSCLLRAPRSLRDLTEPALPLRSGKGALYGQGLSGDLPILALCVDSPEFGELCNELLLAQEFWRLNGVVCDLLLLNEEPEGYLQPIHDAIEDLVRASPANGRANVPGGVHVRRASQMSVDDKLLVLRAARVVLRASAGSFSQQLRRANEPLTLPEPLGVRSQLVRSRASVPPPARDLRFFNGVGGFSADGREYVMYLGPGARPPAPWSNVMANEAFGGLVTEQGLGFTWANNSQRGRVTPWSNDAVEDASGEVLYLRDDEDGTVWSATPAPASLDAHFTVVHGQGYTIFSHTRAGVQHELTVFVSPDDPVKLYRLRIKNRGSSGRKLSVYAVVDWVLGTSSQDTRLHVATRWDPRRTTLFANNPLSVTPEAHAFLASSAAVTSHSGDRQEVFGVGGSRALPAALGRRRLSGRVGVGFDPCGALAIPLELGPGEERELCLALGQGGTLAQAQALAEKYVTPEATERAIEALGALWSSACAITVRTPDEAFDVMMNRWLPYQALSARIWARTGFYQSSGAYGFRDQLQDVLAMLHARPDVARGHLLRAAARQFREGDVQHWWHPDTGEGVRTRCSDDMVFLPYAAMVYVETTGDAAVLDEVVPFLEAPALAEDQEDMFGVPTQSEERASLYEHCARALERATTRGPRGLPKIGGGDWNDGMNRVGREGRGESVWLAWFLARTLGDFAQLAAKRSERERASVFREEAARLLESAEAQAWDGAWYRRAYYDDGSPLGSRANSECRIDAIAQSWAVLAGANQERARQALESSLTRLVDSEAGLMKLLEPPFAATDPDPGYIRSYPPGVRENGGQYTHGVLWTVEALCALGDGQRAHWLLSLLNPINHATNPDDVRRYRVEPYVLAGDVYASPQHLGRGGWTWYTGAAGWMYRIGIESLVGLKRRGSSLELAPCLPPKWQEITINYRYGGTELVIVLRNPHGTGRGVSRLELDGELLSGSTIPLIDDGRRHQATAWLGGAALGKSWSSLPALTAPQRSSGL